MDNQHRHVSYDDCEKSASLSKKIFVAFGHENDSPHFADIVVHIHALCNFYLCLRWQHIHHTCHLAGWFGSTKYFQILSTGCKKHFLKLDFPTVLQRWAFSTRKWLQQIRDSGIYFEHRSGLQHNSKQALTTDERYRVNTPHTVLSDILVRVFGETRILFSSGFGAMSGWWTFITAATICVGCNSPPPSW